MRIFRWAVFAGAVICSTPTYAARCGGDFNTFVSAMSQEAAAAGVSQAVISQAFAGVTQDAAVVALHLAPRGPFNKSVPGEVPPPAGPRPHNTRPQIAPGPRSP